MPSDNSKMYVQIYSGDEDAFILPIQKAIATIKIKKIIFIGYRLMARQLFVDLKLILPSNSCLLS